MCPTKSNGADAANVVPAKTQIDITADFIAATSANQASPPDKPDDGIPLPSTNQTAIHWTEFSDFRAITLTSHSGTWADLIERVRNVGTFDSKAKCPWLKLAKFGNQRTEKRSLRHDANVQYVSGIEGDYDSGLVTPEQAIDRLELHGIRAAVYPSPSCTVEKPR